MWKNLQVFKDNLSQIASDVLDTQEELELEAQSHDDSDDDASANGSHRPSRRRNSNYDDGPNLKAELEWYKSEVNRLQTAESDIQAMSMNYVALLKEREGEVLRLREENGVLKEKMVMATADREVLPNGGPSRLFDLEETVQKLETELCHIQEDHQGQIAALQEKYRMQAEALNAQHRQEIANVQAARSVASGDKSSELASNGSICHLAHEVQLQELELRIRDLQEREQDLGIQVAEKEQDCIKRKDAQEMAMAESERLKELLKTEEANLSDANLQLQRTREAADAALNECDMLKSARQQLSSELVQLQEKADEQDALRDGVVDQFQRTITKLEQEKLELQAEREGLQQALQAQKLEAERSQMTQGEFDRPLGMSEEQASELAARAQEVDVLQERLRTAEEACTLHTAEFERKLEEVSSERDKALRDLSRLKQNLLDMDMSTSEKMDQDSENIAELEARAETSESLVVQLQQSLAQARADQAEAKKRSTEGLQQAGEEIDILKQKLANCIAQLESKDIELSNLQSALGQYYAESEAQDRMHGELSMARDEIAKLAEDVRMANRTIELKSREVNLAVEKSVSAELKKQELEQVTRKLEEDVLRLRRALEQSITRLNRMSSDSDFYVDRRIVIKLLVTYFQRQHSREVLDLMVRMLGFTEEDKRRVGLAQQSASKGGVVRGVFSLPGRFVGGLLGSTAGDGSPGSPRPVPSENPSFADLWIDFLLKESEEREKREKAEADARAADADSVSTGSNSKVVPEPPTSIDPLTAYNSSPVKVSLSRPPSPSPRVNHKPSSSFSGLPSTFLSSLEPTHMDPIKLESQGVGNGPISRTDHGDTAGTEFSSVPLNISTAPHTGFSHGRVPRP